MANGNSSSQDIIRQQWLEIQRYKPHVLSPGSFKFLEGKTRWTPKRWSYIHDIVNLAVLFYSVSAIVIIPQPIEAWQFVTIGTCLLVCAAGTRYLLKRYRRETRIANEGALIVGQIRDIEQAIAGGVDRDDSLGYKIKYVFTSPENKELAGETVAPFSTKDFPVVGKLVVVLYLNEKEFTLL